MLEILLVKIQFNTVCSTNSENFKKNERNTSFKRVENLFFNDFTQINAIRFPTDRKPLSDIEIMDQRERKIKD